MTTLSILKEIIFKLKKKEITSLIAYLKSYKRKSDDHSMKSIQLLNLLLSNKEYSSDHIQRKLYNNNNNYHAFNKLVNRLKEKTYEVILLDSSLDQVEVYGERNCVVFEIRKRLLQIEVMFSRGLFLELEKAINKVIKDAESYEVYDSLIEALQAKQKYFGFRLGYHASLNIAKEIEIFEKYRTAYNRSLLLYNKITSKIIYSISISGYKNELVEAINILKRDFKVIKSATIGYYYFLLLTEYYQGELNYSKANMSLLQLKNLLEKNKSIFTTNRIGNVYLNLANNELLMFKFLECQINSNKALNYLYKNEINKSIVLETEFNALFYLNKIDRAEKLIEELYHSSRFTKTPFLYSKRAYLFACLKTFTAKYSESNELLKEVKAIEKDKEGWGVGIRILSVMNAIELNDISKADRGIEKLERHLGGLKSTQSIRKRHHLIFELLKQLMKMSYDFNKTLNSKQSQFNLLESNHSDYRWKINSPELIIFHEWFKSKAEGRAYNHLGAIQKEKEKYLKNA
jgi:hypothetical protein